MNEKAIKALINQCMPMIAGAKDEALERALLILCQEVERTTRGNAAKAAFDNANRISNLNHE